MKKKAKKKKDKRRRKKKSNRFLLFFFVLVVFLTLVFLIELFGVEKEPTTLAVNMSKEQREGIFFETILFRYPAEVLVIKQKNLTKLNIGVSSDTDRFNFGRIILNVTPVVTKFLSVPNNGKRPVKVKIASYGNISRFIKLSENDMIVKPGENPEIRVVLNITGNKTSTGYYTGEVDINIKVPKYDFLIPALYAS